MCNSKETHERMRQRDAEIAVALQLIRENPEMTKPQAIAAAEKFIQEGRSVNVLVEKDGRKGTYWGKDPYVRTFSDCW